MTKHEANNRSRLINAAQSGRQPGVLRGRLHLPTPEVLMEPLPEQELQAIETSWLS
ncbi:MULTISPECIES: hypothetical protein [unclassified Synechococcus]|uniref:hypothetical protein n=1 Tax=Synechococcales TaxID=1890424 RepID=UPI00162814A8|nr:MULTISPECIES: hypothetical protein [unclassified Synechococcus]